MQESIIEAGWVSKQAGLFKRNTKAWMVLSSEGLFTYKNSGSSTHTTRVPLSDIRSIKKKCPSTFQIQTSSTSHTFYSENTSDRWIDAIQRLLDDPSKVRSPYQEIKAIFANLRSVLAQREEELQAQHSVLFSDQLSLAKKQYERQTHIALQAQKDYERINCFMKKR